MIPTGKRLIVVLGMHRSGTSTITRALNVLGVELGDRLLAPVVGDNAKGYFEDIDLNALNIEMLEAIGSDWHCLAPVESRDVETLRANGFFLRAVDLLRKKVSNVSIFGFKDPRVAKLLPFWHQVFVHCSFDLGYVIAIRNPLSVAQSLKKRAGFSHEKSYALWLNHTLSSLVHTEKSKRVLLDYDQFLQAPDECMDLIANRLDLKINAQELEQYRSYFLDSGLRHTEYDANDLILDPACSSLVQELYPEFLCISRDNNQLDDRVFRARTIAWNEEFDRLKSNLRWIDSLSAKIANLNQINDGHDVEINSLIKSILTWDPQAFEKSFDPDWYLNKYSDVAAAKIIPYQHYIDAGLSEGRHPSGDISKFIRDGLIERLSSLNSQVAKEKLSAIDKDVALSVQEKVVSKQQDEYAERERKAAEQLNDAQRKNESYLLKLADREKEIFGQLQVVQQSYEQQRNTQSREHAARDEILFAQWSQAQQKIEVHLIELSTREKKFAQQLLEVRHANDEKNERQSDEYAAREQTYLEQLAQARQQIESQLIQFAEREKEVAQQSVEIRHANDEKNERQSDEYAAREQTYLSQLTRARQQIENQLIQFAEQEKISNQKFLEIQNIHTQENEKQGHEQSMREHDLLAQLAHAWKQAEIHLIQLAEREKVFVQQSYEIQKVYEQEKSVHNRQHVDRENAHFAQLTQHQLQTETYLLNLSSYQRDFFEQLEKIEQENKQKSEEQSRQYLEREQVLNARLIAGQDELHDLTGRWLVEENKHGLVLAQLQSDLDAMRKTYSWRWTLPLRSFAALMGLGKLDDSDHVVVIKKMTEDPGQVVDSIKKTIKTQLISSSPFLNTNNRTHEMPLNNSSKVAMTLEELLSHHDERFVHCAYHTLLGRAPDSDGMNYYLARVRAGIDKVKILGQLSSSEEGKSKLVRLTGLDVAIKDDHRRTVPFLSILYNFFGIAKISGGTQQKLRAIENTIYVLHLQQQNRLSEMNFSITKLTQLIEANTANQSTKHSERHNESTQKIDEPWDEQALESKESKVNIFESNPIINFDADWYLEQNIDVAESGGDSYEHYISYGKKEGRHPEFDENWYLSQYEDIKKAGINPRDHFNLHGKLEGRYPAFNPDWYLNRYPDVAASGANPLSHYIEHGKNEGRFPAYSKFNADGNNYPKWIIDFDTITDDLRAAMIVKSSLFKNKPLISVVMPVYNPNPVWLVEVIESIRSQIYPNWELCIADDLSPNQEIRPILERYALEDGRIKVVFREKNGHISRATNSALEIAQGTWVALLDHDDILPEHALFWVVDAINENPEVRMIYSDEDKINEKGVRFGPYFKCDWNPDLFYSHNMFSHLGVYHLDLIRKVGGFRVGLEGSQDYDLALRCIEKISREQIHHIPRVLYHWRVHAESTASSPDAKPYAMIAGERAINEHFERQGINAKAELITYGYRVRYALPKILPLVSLIIPTRNGLKLLQQCIESILKKTTYANYEIIIVDNGSDDLKTLNYLGRLNLKENIRVVRDDSPFNYSALNNSAVKFAKGEIIGLINNDIEVISPDWLSEMVSHALRPEVGAVGAKLLYPDDTVQHAGVILGVTGIAAHAHKNLPRTGHGYFSRANLIQSFSAVTAACLIIKKSIYESVGGLNEKDLQVAFNDVDFCIRIRDAGFRNIWTPYAELYHHESATRGYENSPEKIARFAKEVSYMEKIISLNPDPAYSPNLTLDSEDFSLAWPPRVDNINVRVN